MATADVYAQQAPNDHGHGVHITSKLTKYIDGALSRWLKARCLAQLSCNRFTSILSYDEFLSCADKSITTLDLLARAGWMELEKGKRVVQMKLPI